MSHQPKSIPENELRFTGRAKPNLPIQKANTVKFEDQSNIIVLPRDQRDQSQG
jgi:hypothetical protein